MTPLEAAAIARAQSRVGRLQPEMTSRILKAWQILREMMTDAEVTRFMKAGKFELLIEDVLTEPDLDRAFLAFRQEIRQAVQQSYSLSIKDLPKAGRIDGVVGVAFDHLAPQVVTAIRTLETPVLSALKSDVRETVRAAIQKGLEDGKAPRTVARGIRDVIGLGKGQWEQVANFRDALEGKNGRSLSDYALRDKRLDKMMAKGPLSEAQVDRYVESYTKRRIAANANTVARTATLDSYKLGQKLSWVDAQDNGVVPDGFRAMRQWIGMDDDRERPEHLAMNNEIVPADEPYSSGQKFAGEGDWGCRCIDRYFIARV